MKQISLFAFYIFFTFFAEAQTTNLTIITHKTNGFIKNPALKWLNINQHKLPANVNYDPQLFLWAAVDTSDFRKDANGYKYFKSKLFFGFKDQEEFYELPQPVYAGTGNKFRTHSLMWRFNSFYLLTNDLIDSTKRNVVLFRLDKNKALSSAVLESNPLVGNYAKLNYDDQHGANYVSVSYLNTEKSRVENYYIREEIYKAGTQQLDSVKTYTTNKDIGHAKIDKELNPIKYYTDVNDLAAKWYTAASNPDYDHKQYLLNKKKILIQSPISHQYEQQSVTNFSTTTLPTSEKSGWRSIRDLYNRNTSSLFFQLKTDSTVFKTDSKKRKYLKTFIRFGFADDENGYQLPGSFYIMEKQERFLAKQITLEKMQFKNPCLMFTDEKFFVFVPNYAGEDQQEALMFTHYIGKGLVKEILWKGKANGSALLPYFSYDDEGFSLIHSDEEMHNLSKTYQQNGSWKTINIDLNVYQPILENTYAEQIQPYCLPIMPEPFKRESAMEKYYCPVVSLSVFTNTPEDKEWYKKIIQLPLAQGIEKFQVAEKDRQNYNWYGSDFYPGKGHEEKVFYTPLNHMQVLIPNMPESRNQEPFSSCESYAYASLYQQYLNSDWQLTQMREIDPKALHKETDISYFGMQQYLRGNKAGIDPNNLWMYGKKVTEDLGNYYKAQAPDFDFEFRKGSRWVEPFEIILQNENKLDSIPYFVLKYYTLKGIAHAEVEGKFRAYLQQLYSNNKTTAKENSAYQNEINELHEMTGIPVKNIDLQKSFDAPTFQSFLYNLFFNKCTEFIPLSSINNLLEVSTVNEDILKREIVKTLYSGKPVEISIYYYPNLHKDGHAVVICGYKKVVDPATGKVLDVFKIHNSWGKELDYTTKGCWFLADYIISYMTSNRFRYLPGLKSLSKDWIENTPDYKRIYKNTHTDVSLSYKLRPIGVTEGTNQKDAEPLYTMVTKYGYDYYAAAQLYKKYFTTLGYAFKSEDTKAREIHFEGLDVWLGTREAQIVCPNEAALDKLKSKMDFSKIKGRFIQGKFSDTGEFYLKTDQYY